MFHAPRYRHILSATLAIAGFAALINTSPVSAAIIYSTGFASVAGLTGEGWTFQNNSSPVGSTNWFQGNTAFSAQSGPSTSYLAANFNNTTGSNTISNWAVTPTLTYANGYTFNFFSRTRFADAMTFPDRLQVRLSTNGSSANVGATSDAVGDFTTLLLDINPTLTQTGYPATWTQFSATLSGLAAPVSGRIAFRYFVPNGGPTGANSEFIGIDTLNISDGVLPPPPPPPSTAVGIPASVAATLAGASEIDWYSFVGTGEQTTINTLGSTLGTLAADNDTEIGLFDAAGNLLNENDDINFAGGNLLSSITTNSLTAGATYYVAVGAFNSTFGSGFSASSTSTITGNYRLNITSVPEVGTMAMLGMGMFVIGGVISRRKRSG